ncbi:MAG: hypothetical protein HYX63_18950 [Gammaproteobacteria bacterium]|nr:hypothetical protein [Gammaproteobacteria bacterium]
MTLTASSWTPLCYCGDPATVAQAGVGADHCRIRGWQPAQSFEDAVALNSCFRLHKTDIYSALLHYERVRHYCATRFQRTAVSIKPEWLNYNDHVNLRVGQVVEVLAADNGDSG